MSSKFALLLLFVGFLALFNLGLALPTDLLSVKRAADAETGITGILDLAERANKPVDSHNHTEYVHNPTNALNHTGAHNHTVHVHEAASFYNRSRLAECFNKIHECDFKGEARNHTICANKFKACLPTVQHVKPTGDVEGSDLLKARDAVVDSTEARDANVEPTSSQEGKLFSSHAAAARPKKPITIHHPSDGNVPNLPFVPREAVADADMEERFYPWPPAKSKYGHLAEGKVLNEFPVKVSREADAAANRDHKPIYPKSLAGHREEGEGTRPHNKVSRAFIDATAIDKCGQKCKTTETKCKTKAGKNSKAEETCASHYKRCYKKCQWGLKERDADPEPAENFYPWAPYPHIPLTDPSAAPFSSVEAREVDIDEGHPPEGQIPNEFPIVPRSDMDIANYKYITQAWCYFKAGKNATAQKKCEKIPIAPRAEKPNKFSQCIQQCVITQSSCVTKAGKNTTAKKKCEDNFGGSAVQCAAGLLFLPINPPKLPSNSLGLPGIVIPTVKGRDVNTDEGHPPEGQIPNEFPIGSRALKCWQSCPTTYKSCKAEARKNTDDMKHCNEASEGCWDDCLDKVLKLPAHPA